MIEAHAMTSTCRGKLRLALPCAALLLSIAGCGQSAPAEDKKDAGDNQAGVTLTPEQVKDLGIATTPARAAIYRQTVSGYGAVVALDTIAQADADVASALAAAAQSAAAAVRARSLSTGEEAAVSREVVEATQSKAAADQAALGLAERKLQSAFGFDAPWKTPAARKAVMAKLASGEASLARITFPLGSLGGQQPSQISVARLGNATQSWACRTVWEAPADPNLPGNGYYCLLGRTGLAQNEHLTARVGLGPELPGVWIPQAALLVGENNSWIYVEPETGHFVRVPVDTGKPDKDGFFLDRGAGVTPNEKIVTGAAGLLMARETNPSTEAGD
jgi:hypothetical protein